MTEAIATTSRHESKTCSRSNSLLANRWLWPGLAALALFAGAALNWNWLVAAGVLPILFAAVLPVPKVVPRKPFHVSVIL